MGHQQLYWSHPRKFGQGSRSCRVCSNRHGLIRKYGLNMCRQCFRQYAKDIGFIKASIVLYPPSGASSKSFIEEVHRSQQHHRRQKWTNNITIKIEENIPSIMSLKS
uniref:Small ribosomal subunit protein uS14 n=1 Tax=Mola mola TaxID=94237 RepID=A0A3Q3VUS4_MOLML